MGLEGADQFSRELIRLGRKSNQLAEDVFRQLSIAASVPVIRGTPVDTGRARGGWVPSLNSPSASQGRASKTGQASINASTRTAARAQLGDRYILTNNVDYVPILEGGVRLVTTKLGNRKIVGSEQADSGWIERGVDTVRRDFERRVRQLNQEELR